MYFHNSLSPRGAYFLLPLESKQEANSGWNFTKCISEVKVNQLKVKNMHAKMGISIFKFYLLPTTLNLLANALVFPHFDYCSPVWTNCICELSNSLQILQNKLACVLLSADIRRPISDMMNILCWDKLHERWNKHLLVIVFKCLHHKAPSYLSSQFIFTS